jgi:hypothetical protein
MNRSLAAIAAIAFLGILPGVSLAQEPKVRDSMDLSGGCWIGQRVTFVVELMAPGFFSGAASFDLPDPPGLLLIPPTSSPILSSEEIGGTSYTVQRYELFVVARRGGEQTVPPIAVRFHFKRHPLDKEAAAGELTTEPVIFAVKIPPGAESLESIISARNLTAVETWKPEPGKSKAGDAFTRTITQSAPDVPAMAFPPFPIGKVDGLGMYPKPPEVADQVDHGESTGRRQDTITYVCQRPGQFVVPAAQLSWFDIDAKKIRVIEFPARTFDVAANPRIGAAVPQAQDSHILAELLWVIGGAGAVIMVAAICAVLIRRYWSQWSAPFRPVHLSPLNPS